MKRIIAGFLLLLLGATVFGQDIDSVTLAQLKLNFAIPDMPAFKALGTDPSGLLRPSTPQALAVSMSEFYSGGKLAIPEAFALEITPALLLNTHKGLLGLQQYSKNKIANSFRISLGSSSDTSLSPSGRNVALGFRISLINNGDLATDAAYLSGVSIALNNFRKQVRNTTLVEFALLHNINTSEVDWEENVFGNPDLKKQFDDYLANQDEPAQKGFTRILDSIKKDYKEKNWNATKLDLAVAILSSSSDSLVKNIRFNKTELWLAYALKAGRNGQFIAGLHSSLSKNLKDTAEVSKNNTSFTFAIPVRYLIGTNRIKGFAEGAYKYINDPQLQQFMFQIGAEINPLDGIWFNIYGGLDYDLNSGNSAFTTSLNLKLTLPENFKFF